jgi:hypothetical protein
VRFFSPEQRRCVADEAGPGGLGVTVKVHAPVSHLVGNRIGNPLSARPRQAMRPARAGRGLYIHGSGTGRGVEDSSRSWTGTFATLTFATLMMMTIMLVVMMLQVMRT